MWVAYLIPKQDLFLLREDGVGFIAKGKTKEEAETNLRKNFEEAYFGDPKHEIKEIWEENTMFSQEV